MEDLQSLMNVLREKYAKCLKKSAKNSLSEIQSWQLIYFNNQALDQSYQHSSSLL